MKMLGAHMSVAGGIDRAFERGADVGCEAIQIFTRNNNQWKCKPLDDGMIDRVNKARSATGIKTVVAHGSYLINLASPEAPLYRKSIEAFGVELDRCEALGIGALIAHPGAHVGSGEEAGIRRIARGLNRLLEKQPGQGVRVLLETTAGQGSSIGHTFEHLRDIIGAVESADRLGVCIDTCHIFAAGYDIRTQEGYHEVMDRFDRVVGLDRVQAFHLNDCKKELGCRVDRHEHIGEGFIGKEGFRCLMNDSRFDGVPMVLETPKGPDYAEDKVNLALLRTLESQAAGAGRRKRAVR